MIKTYTNTLICGAITTVASMYALDQVHTRLLFVCMYFLPCVWYKTLGKSQHGYPSLSSTDFCPLLIYNINRLLYDMLIKFECKLSEKKNGDQNEVEKKTTKHTAWICLEWRRAICVLFHSLVCRHIFKPFRYLLFESGEGERDRIAQIEAKKSMQNSLTILSVFL